MRVSRVALVAVAFFLLAVLLLLLARRGQVPLEGNADKISGPSAAQPSRQVATVRIEADVANATASVNWSLRSLPAVLEVPAGSLLVVEPMPAGLYEPLNSTLLLRVAGNITVTLKYRRSALLVSVKATYPLLVNGEPVRDGTVLRVRLNSSLSFGSACADLGNGTALCSDRVRVVRGGVVEEFPLNATLAFSEDVVVEAAGFRAYRVSFILPCNLTFTVNGTAYAGNASIWVREGSAVVVDASPVSYNDTHDLRVVGWVGTGLGNETAGWPSFGARIVKPSAFRAVTGFVRKKYPIVTGVVYYNGRPVETRVVPGHRDLIIAFSGTYEYVGDGWWHLQGATVSVYVQPPGNWTRAVVYVRAKKGWGFHYIELMMQAYPCFGTVGWGVESGEFMFEFVNGIGRGRVLAASGNYYETAAGVSAGFPCIRGANTEGVDAGWFRITLLGGELWFKVEFYG